MSLKTINLITILSIPPSSNLQILIFSPTIKQRKPLTERRVGVGVKNAAMGAGGGQKGSAEGYDLGYRSAAQGGPREPSGVGQRLGSRLKAAKCALWINFWL